MEGRRFTLGGVAGFVVLCEVVEVLVLEPGHPLLVFLVVLLLGPVHDVFRDAVEPLEFLLAGGGWGDVLNGRHGG